MAQQSTLAQCLMPFRQDRASIDLRCWSPLSKEMASAEMAIE
jgi:hypothetical protein